MKHIGRIEVYQYGSVHEATLHRKEMEEKGWALVISDDGGPLEGRFFRGADALMKDFERIKETLDEQAKRHPSLPVRNPNKRPTVINCNRSNARVRAETNELIRRIRYGR